MATITSPRPQSPASSSRTHLPQISQSPSLTPTSSVRASLDLSTNGRSSSPAPANGAQRRNRAALRDYYNLKSKAASSQNPPRTASIASTTSDGTVTSATAPKEPSPHAEDAPLTSQLDETDFDPEAYVQHLLRSSSLKSILRTEATLISEIKDLDGERKALVYDNYSKLIKATQTIGNMQKSMNEARGGSLKTMETLQPAVEGLSRMAIDLSRTTAAETGGMRSSRVRRQIRAEEQRREIVRRVLDAPKHLGDLLEEGRAAEMQDEWKIVNGILDKWHGVKGVEDLRRKCEQVVAQDNGAVA